MCIEDFTYYLKNFEGICGFTVDVTLEDIGRSRFAQEIRTAGALYRYLYKKLGLLVPSTDTCIEYRTK
jgi:hypothetical protein